MPAGFPHSDTPGSQLGCQLPGAYRRLQRPSSALDAKASTMCPSQLATTNTTPHPTTGRVQRRRRPATKETHTTTGQTGRHAQIQNPPTHTPTAIQHSYSVRIRVSGRCSRPLSTSQTTTPHHPPPARRADGGVAGPKHSPTTTHQPGGPRGAGEASEPQQCVPTPGWPSITQSGPRGRGMGVDGTSTNEHHHDGPVRRPDECLARTTPVAGRVLLRKEVIQPHLPVRLPCYDFVPIASPTFDHSLQQAGWAMGFGCCRLS